MTVSFAMNGGTRHGSIRKRQTTHMQGCGGKAGVARGLDPGRRLGSLSRKRGDRSVAPLKASVTGADPVPTCSTLLWAVSRSPTHGDAYHELPEPSRQHLSQAGDGAVGQAIDNGHDQ